MSEKHLQGRIYLFTTCSCILGQTQWSDPTIVMMSWK